MCQPERGTSTLTGSSGTAGVAAVCTAEPRAVDTGSMTSAMDSMCPPLRQSSLIQSSAQPHSQSTTKQRAAHLYEHIGDARCVAGQIKLSHLNGGSDHERQQHGDRAHAANT